MSKSLSMAQKEHGARIAAHRAINGQPNGYKPVTEAELQREREGRRIITNIGDYFAAYSTWRDAAEQAIDDYENA